MKEVTLLLLSNVAVVNLPTALCVLVCSCILADGSLPMAQLYIHLQTSAITVFFSLYLCVHPFASQSCQ